MSAAPGGCEVVHGKEFLTPLALCRNLRHNGVIGKEHKVLGRGRNTGKSPKMPQATAAQITYIKSLLADRAHTDSGKTITVGETRVRATASTIDTISATVASKLITALKAAPKVERPRFRDYHGQWFIAQCPASWKEGDIVEVLNAKGKAVKVIIGSPIGANPAARHFTFAEPKPTKESTTPAEAPAAKAPASRPASRPARGTSRATAAQVSYIMTLISQGRHEEGGFYAGPTTYEGVKAMSREDASIYIKSLTGRY